MTKKKLSSADWSLIEDLYISEESTIMEISKRFDCSVPDILNHLRRNRLEIGQPKPENIIGEPTKAVEYLITTRGRKPQTESELMMAPGIRVQKLCNKNYATKHNLEIIRTFHAHLLNYDLVFLGGLEFNKAHDFAIENNCKILVYDLFRYLAQLSFNLLQLNFGEFVNGVVEIVHTKAWYSVSAAYPDTNQVLYDEATLAYSLRKRMSKNPLKPKRKDSLVWDPIIASDVAKYSAKRKRQTLEPDILNVISDLKSEGKVSLQLIADELNRRGIKSPRGRPWSKGTITNILKKLEIDHRK